MEGSIGVAGAARQQEKRLLTEFDLLCSLLLKAGVYSMEGACISTRKFEADYQVKVADLELRIDQANRKSENLSAYPEFRRAELENMLTEDGKLK